MHSNDNTTTFAGATPGLADRAIRLARAVRATCPNGFRRRLDTPEQWSRWARRARVARTVAAALQVPADSVTVTDDPHRQYRTRNGVVPGDLITVTDSARQWRLLTDFTSPGESWLVLDRCHGCDAEVPVARIACLADFGDYLDPDTELVLADEARDTSLHQPHCVFVLSN
ncbi:hypothetical protein AB0A63_00080 [Lentzea sp. NPDC042327]|uniref:hypothetical protein n=1 Tax=Lentzea sp. NPDC042327 TaxID=3154801 RepID=UPI0033E0F463